MAGEEYVEVTPEGPVRMIPVRVNVNQLALTCEKIVSQKKELHIQSFEYAVQALRQQLMSEEKRFAARFSQDSSSLACKNEKVDSLERLADGIMEECHQVLEKHREYNPEAVLDDDLFRCLVHEMLSAVRMGRSKLDLYLEDRSRYLFLVKDMPIRSAHRERIASLYKHLETMEPCEDRLKISLTLCKAEGLLKESVMEKNELGETKIIEAAADDWKPSHIRLLTAAGANVNEKMIDGTTATMKAATCGHTATVKELHTLGADEPCEP